MDISRFGEQSPGRLVPTTGGVTAFVPNPLPPTVRFEKLLNRISEASKLMGELNGIGTTVPNPMMLIRPLQRQEALTSSAMEGTYTTLTELALLEAREGGAKQPTSDTREVLNYVQALAHGLALLKTLPLCLRVIRETYAKLMTNLGQHRGGHVDPGEFKRDQNFIGGWPIENARFVPPPPQETLICLDRLEKYIQRDDAASLPQIVDAALVHYQFEAIHPFPDGNGRVGRMLIALMLHERRVLAQPLLYLSPFLESRKNTYIDLMFDVSVSGKWEEWIDFFCVGVIESCKNTIQTIGKLRTLQDTFRGQVRSSNNSARLLGVVDSLFENPVTSAKRIETEFAVTSQTAHNYIGQLTALGIISEIPELRHPKYYQSAAIMSVLRN